MKTLSKLVFAGLLVSGSLLGTQVVLGHHSTIGQISTDVTEIEGTVKEFQFTNPHSWIQVYVTNENGEVEEWSVEWGIPNSLMRQGIRPNTFTPGMAVKMKLRQHVSGSPMGEFNGALLADGSVIGNW